MKTTFFRSALTAFAAASLPALALAEGGVPAGTNYFGIQHSDATYEEQDLPEMEPSMALLRIGSFSSDNVAVEARLGTGISDGELVGTYMGNPVELTINVDSLLGVYLMPGLPVGDHVRLYGALGLTHVNLTAEVHSVSGSGSASDDDASFSWGAGAEIWLSSDTALTVEYMTYMDKPEFELSSTGVGLSFRY